MRKEGNDYERERPKVPLLPTHERPLDYDLNNLLRHLARAPNILQQQFAPVLYHLKKDMPQHQKLNEFLDNHLPNPERIKLIENYQHLVHNYTYLLQRRQLADTIDSLLQKGESILKAQARPSEPDVVDRLDLIYPDYDSYYKMSKQQKSHLTQYHPKNKIRQLFTEPRFIVKIEQFAHFRNNDQQKGDIIYLQYQGNTVTFAKTYLVANQKALEFWAMETNQYPIPTLTIPNEEEADKKKEDEKKEKEKEETTQKNLKIQFQHKFLGHTEKITSISLSQDQYYAITGSADRTVRLWCLRLKICLAIYRGHTKVIWDVSFSPSGYYFLSGSGDGLMLLWKTDEPHAQRAYYHESDIYKVSFAKDPSYVISAGEDATIKIWNTIEANIVRKIKLSEPVINFSLGFSGAYLIAIENDGKVTVFDMLRGSIVNSFYFYEPQRRKRVEEKENESQKLSIMKIHDACLSEDERELTCICSHYVLVYSMDKLEKKVTSNIFTFYKTNQQSEKVVVLQPKEVLYLGGETNLTHCSYQSKNVLVVAGTTKH